MAERVWYIPEDITWKLLPSGVVVLSLNEGSYYSFNETGSLVWQDIVARKNHDEIVDHVADSFDCTEAQARADVKEFVEYLRQERLLCAE